MPVHRAVVLGTTTTVAPEHTSDLLVVGNQGRDPLAGRWLGSVPSEVARRSEADVLIVPTT
jgi:nucleotide-binding universal stress UspA family protein